MKAAIIFFFTILLIFFIASCKDNNAVSQNCILKGHILKIEIPDTVITNKTYNTKVDFILPNRRWFLNDLSYSYSGDSIYIKAISYCKNAVCTDEVFAFTEFLKISYQRKGIFNLIINDSIFVKQIVVI